MVKNFFPKKIEKKFKICCFVKKNGRSLSHPYQQN
jgi:hypothetical protein